MIMDLGIRCSRESCRSSAVESHIFQNRADIGHPSFVTGRERKVCEKSRLKARPTRLAGDSNVFLGCVLARIQLRL